MLRTILSLTACAAMLAVSRANDGIFPPSPAAAAVINFDGKGFLINGKREFIASGSIHFPRVPRELWHERLLQLKRAGFNTVESYIFWNYHETLEGQIDFTSGAHDLGAFLEEAQKVGLYAVVRVGPYVCAEWNNGGYPVWLRNKPELRVRSDSPPYLEAVDKFWDKLIPIIAAHQIHRGGNVIFVQLENEDPQGWGTDMPNEYFKHMQRKALDLGIEVPYFFSGLHHGPNPAGANPWSSENRTNPWYSAETWIRWFDTYGEADPETVAMFTRNIWNHLANGANGFNLYMFYGGTNFDYFNYANGAASYDFGTLVGQAGEPRHLYYTIRRATTLATSFPDIFEKSDNSTPTYTDFAVGRTVTHATKSMPSVTCYARTSPDGTIVFARNGQKTLEPLYLKSNPTSDQTTTLDPLEIAPFLVDATLAPGVRAKVVTARTFGLAKNGSTTTWLVYGKAGDRARLGLEFDKPATVVSGGTAAGFQVQTSDASHPVIDVVFSTDVPHELLLTAGGQMLRILAETPDWVDRTWIVGERGKQEVVVGAGYVGDFSETNGKAQFSIERRYGEAAPTEITIYGSGAQARHVAVNDPEPKDDSEAPKFDSWQMARMAGPAAPNYADSAWQSSDQPLQLGSDGDPSAYGWYHASFDSPTAGRGHLAGNFADNAIVFLNGKLVGPTHDEAGIDLDLQSGKNTLAIFVSFRGREKAYGYFNKRIDVYHPKGIISPISITMGGQTLSISGWKMRGGIGTPDDGSLAWEAAPGADLGAPAFFRTHFTGKPPGAVGMCPIYRISMQGLTRGNIWLNGHNLGRYPENLTVDGLYLPECWLKDGDNSLAIFDEEGRIPPSSVRLWCEKTASREVIPVQE